MRGGAIPLVAWGTILLVLYIVHAIWNGRTVPTIATGFAVLAIYGFGVCVWILGRDTLRRGPPAARSEAEAWPSASLGAVMAGLSFACILFGVVWSNFLVYFGGAMLLLSLGRLGVEVRSEYASKRHAQEEMSGR